MPYRALTLVAVLALLSIAGAAALDQKPAAAPKANLANCPVSLSNPDGQDLVLEKMDVRIAAHGPLSLTEVEMVFRNPEARQMEGRFLYVLPTGATVSRFAKEVNGQLMEGEVVETQAARRAYREILHTMRDPALLEQDQGNRFSAKVFPIPANGTARLLLSYSRVTPLVDGERKLIFPLLGLPAIGEFNFRANIWPLAGESLTGKDLNVPERLRSGPDSEFTLNKKDFTPKADIEIIGKADGKAAPVEALRAGDYQMTVFRPAAVKLAAEKAVGRDWVFYIDTSASGVDTEARRNRTLAALYEEVDENKVKANKLNTFAFDIEVAPLLEPYERLRKDGAPHFGGTRGELKDTLERKLRARHALGATDLGKALKHLGELARATEAPACFVLVSDGIPTWGAKEIPELLATLGEWPKQHVLHALVIGQKQDEKVLAALTEKTGGRVVVASLSQDSEASASAALAALTKPMGRSFEFYDEGAAWIYPKTFQDVQPGSELVVFSQLKDSVAAKPGVVERVDGKPVDTPLTLAPKEVAEFAPLLKREAIGAELSHMEKLEQAEKDAGKVATSKAKRIELSVKNRVLCAPLTSLLVLETERDYARFKIDRNALGEIMVVGARGIEMQGRKPVELAKAPEAKPEAPKLQVEQKAKRVERMKEADDKVNDGVSMNGERLAGKMEKDDAAGDADLDAEKSGWGAGQGGGQGGQAGEAHGIASRDALIGEGREAPAHAEPAAPPLPALAPAPIAPPGDRAREVGAAEAPNKPQPAPQKFVAPDWVKLAGYKPAEPELNALRAQLATQPMNRALRNTYADGLARLNKWDELQAFCFDWLPNDPENAQVYEFLGKSAAGLGDKGLALRALSSLAEIGPKNAALLGRAGWVLLASKHTELAADLFQAALKERQDDPNLYRGLALAQWLGGKNVAALKTYEAALKVEFHQRYGDVQRVLREEAAYVARATGANLDGEVATELVGLEKSMGLDLKRTDALRVTMGWETDANDVDLHVVDPSGEECWYSHKMNVSKLELYSDQTQGLGPEVVRTETALKGNYEVGVTYFNAGPMGVSRGVVVVFKPENGQVREPQIIPFVLLPESTGGANIRPVATVKF